MAGGSQKLWEGMDQGDFGQAQQFANQGNWGQAAQAYQQGGGQGFTQPQAQAFTQQYGNVGSPGGQLGGVFGQPGVPHPESFGSPGGGYGEVVFDGPGSGMWGPTDQENPNYITGGGFQDAAPPPGQAQPMPPMNIPGRRPMIPPPPMAAPTPPSPGFMGHQNVSAGRLAEAQRLGKIAGIGGNMGLAKQQWELGGGKWSPDAHMFLDGRLAGGGLLS